MTASFGWFASRVACGFCSAGFLLVCSAADMKAVRDSASGQIDITEGGKPVLRYNYRMVEPGEILSQVSEDNRKYARSRSDYLHPLYGPAGEILTRDWPVDHPHHRGIYWAWPEVDFGKERGDLHALQRLSARPTGQLKLAGDPLYAQIEAENLWIWENRESIVREWAVLRAHPATDKGRIVDVQFELVGLTEGITLARRGTSNYGGLNLRLATPTSQKISVHTDPPGSPRRRAWSDLSGVFPGAKEASGVSVFQHPSNPEYPGDWVQYPDLSWVQPTFPSAGKRHPLPPNRPLVLRYRLWLHPGGPPAPDVMARLFDEWQATPPLKAASSNSNPQP